MTLDKSIQDYSNSLEKSKTQYSGLLGLPIDGSKKVNVPNRAGYVYVRLRDNLSEVIQAINDKISPVYDFPVLMERRNNRWYITGRDDARYETWGTSAPFLPQHGDQHSFNRDGGGGGDPVAVYPDQFMPLLVYPSGTSGAGSLLIAPYMLEMSNRYAYVGNTGTVNLLQYRPLTNQAIMGLVGIDRDTGNPSILIASGTPFDGTLTGSSYVAQYIPYPPQNIEPLYAFRLVSGTTSLNWPNLYNARQIFRGRGSTATGSSGGISGIVAWDEGTPVGTGTVMNFVGSNVNVTVSGTVINVMVTGSSSSIPTFITGSIPYAGSNGILTENNELLWWDESNRGFRLGQKNARFNFADTFPIGITAKNQDESISIGLLAYGTGSSGAPSAGVNFYRSRGSLFAQEAVKSGDLLGFVAGRGYDGSTHAALSRINFIATGNAITGSYAPTGIDMLVVPSGSATSRSQLTVYGDSVNIPTGSTYNVGGIPHTHQDIPTSGWNFGNWTGLARVSDYVFETTTDITGIVQKGYKLRFTDTTTKYLSIITVSAYTGGKTTITCASNTSYKFVGTPSSFYWSNIDLPFAWPEWFTVAAPTFDVTMMDDGAGGQPTTTDCRMSVKGRMVNLHIKGNGTKVGTTWYFAFSASDFPTPQNYATSAISGYCNAGWSGKDLNGTVKVISGSFYFVFDEDRLIPDNQVVSAYSCNIAYEI